MSSVIDQNVATRVSSVLNRDVKQFGKKYMFDNSDETCWNSDQGSPQWVQLEFPGPTCVQEIHIQFQGGFAGKQCDILGCSENSSELHMITQIYPEDVNSVQIFNITGSENNNVTKLKINFVESTDFFGRITVYKLDIIGSR